MRMTMCCLALLGCAHTATVDTAQTVRLPQEDRQAILNADQNVDIARQNVTAAQVALDEARQFRSIANRELDSAKSRLEAAKGSMALDRRAQAGDSARGEYDLATRQLFAARAKKDYAEKLVDLRHAQLDEREAFLRSTEADRESAKYQALDRNGLASNLRGDDFERSRSSAQKELADKRMKTAQIQGAVESLRATWDERRRDFDTASRDTTPSPLKAPPPPEPLPMPNRTFNPPPAGDINEGPSAPGSLPE